MKGSSTGWTWRAGVIAAGHGSRLRTDASSALRIPKPLVIVAGQPLIDHVLWSLGEVNPEKVVVIVNEASAAVQTAVSARSWPFPIQWIVETTPSSMHSFLRVLERLAADGHQGPFLLSTVDTVAPPGVFAAVAAASLSREADVTLAVVRSSDDETPLLVRAAAEDGRVLSIGTHVRDAVMRDGAMDDDKQGEVFATAGFYVVRASIAREAAAARQDGLSALRQFLERLHARGYVLRAVVVDGAVDVDRPSDVMAAERVLNLTRP